MCEFEYKGKLFSFTEKLLKEYEVICVKALNHNIDTTTVYDYLKYFLSLGVIFTNDHIKKRVEGTEEELKLSLNSSGISKLKSVVSNNFYSGSLSEKICSLALNILDNIIEGNINLNISKDPKFVESSQLNIACGCISVARELAKMSDIWNPVMEDYFKIKFASFENTHSTIKRYNKTYKLFIIQLLL